jgi:Ca2+-transporting ATPase
VEIVREPMTLLLLGCGGIYLLLGDPNEALMLLGFVVFIAGITIYQQRKTERAIEALRELASPRALVIREGRKRRVAGRELVRGDTIVLAEGDRVPADATVFSTTGLMTDESLLTGESVPVRKRAWDGFEAFARPGGDDLPFVYSGSLVVHGAAIARVHATGARGEIGRIGQSLRELEPEDTPLQRETQALVKKIAFIAAAVSASVVVAYALLKANWIQGLLAGLTLAMAILPNEFPVVVTIFLALGAWRLSRRRVLTRRAPAVETIGSATVLCVDKTGTLTQNKMTVRKLVVGEHHLELSSARQDLPRDFHELVEYAILASRWREAFDPMDLALHELGQDHGGGPEELHPEWTLVRDYPLTASRLAVARAFRRPDGNVEIAMKGAPELVARFCRLEGARREQVLTAVAALGREGLRVLAVARTVTSAPLPDDPALFALRWVGLVAFEDPIRPSVPAAVRECLNAGIRVAIVSGDYPSTVQSIGRQIGVGPEDVLTGAEIEALDDVALRQRVRYTNLFARVLPEQKLRLVEAFKASGEIVAMTGDGVNDAPALKAAHIGIAMGARGTDVAREAATIVLLDDDFASIEQGVRLGRRILDNLRKALAYILAVHLPILGLTLLPILLGWPLVLLPVHIAFLHLVIDPACSVVFEAEPEERNVMRRPPRSPAEPLFGGKLLIVSFLQGLSVLAVVAGVLAIAHYRGHGELDSRALTFATLVVANLALIVANRSWSTSGLRALRVHNPALWWVIAGTLVFLGAVVYVPALRALFRFESLHLIDWAVCLVAGAVSVAWFELLKTRRSSRRAAFE